MRGERKRGLSGKGVFLLLAVATGAASSARADEFSSAEQTSRSTAESFPNSVSCGSTNRGALSDAAELAVEGPGYVMAEPWRSRGANFGTVELVSLIADSSREVAEEFHGSVLGVADLSLERGGALASHRSHQNGRDVDLIFYAVDSEGQPYYPDSHMAYYKRDGRALYARSPRFERSIPERFFDLKRNWALVRAMLSHPSAEVEHIFVSPRIERWLIAYARTIGEPSDFISMAQRVLHAPRKVRGHNDHMHVRIACSADDIAMGRCKKDSAPKPRRGTKWHTRVRCPKPVSIQLPRS